MFRRAFLASTAAFGALASTTLTPRPARAKGSALRIGLITPPAHQWTKSAVALAERIAAVSGGDITLTVLPAGQVGTESQMLQQLQTGALDMAFMTIGEFASRDADYGALTAPYLVPDIPAARSLLAKPAATELLTRTRKLGLEGLGFGLAGMRQILLRRPAPTVADLAGRKIRSVPLPQEMDFWTRVGAAPTPLPLPAVYDAMMNGQIDGMQIDFEGVWHSRYFDLAQELLASDHMLFPMLAVASARRWKTLPEAQRSLIEAEVRTELGNILSAYEEIDISCRKLIESQGFPVRKVGAAYFGPAIGDWYAHWRTQTPILAQLESEAGRA